MEFWCECGSRDCLETVVLTPASYEALRLTNHPVLAPDHALGRIREAQRTTTASGGDAGVLALEAAQQQRRSRRSIAAAPSQVRGRVLVVDDSETFQRVSASVVSEAQGLRLVGVASSGEDAIRLLPELKPDLVLLDIHMPGISGLETAPLILRERPSTVIVLISAAPDGVTVDLASIGAVAFLSKVELSPRKLEELWLVHVPRA